MDRKLFFPLQASLDDCASPESEWTNTFLLKTHVGVDDVGTTSTTNAQAAAREEFARPSKNRQQQKVTAWGSEQTKQFDPGDCGKAVFVFFFLTAKFPQAGTRGEEIFFVVSRTFTNDGDGGRSIIYRVLY